MMSWLLFLFGIVFVGTALLDALRTTVSVGGGGPLTTRLARGLWAGALKWHRYRAGRSRLLGATGTIILLSIFALWILLLWGGYLLLFSADPTAVVSAKSGVPAELGERIYFTGYTISTLGMGDFVPNGTGWRVLAAFASLNGLFLVTLSITYLLPVLSAVVAKRRLAATIADLGHTPREILENGWDGDSLDSLEQPLSQLAPMIGMHAQHHLVYPVLHFFRSDKGRTAIGPRVAALSEAIRLIKHLPSEAQPPPASVHAVRQAIDGFLGTLSSAFIHHTERAPDPPKGHAPRQVLQEAGLSQKEMDDAEGDAVQAENTPEQERRRRLLYALVRDGGWTWDDVVHRRLTTEN